MTALIPVFGNASFTLLAFIVALSILVTVHEFGHYIVGRLSGIKADVFSLGFGPVLASRIDRHGTRWQVAAIPLGGYVRFKGDANAASAGGTDQGRDSMPGAPLWARTLTVAAGPIFNFILSVLIFAGMALSLGVPASPVVLKDVPDLPPPYVQELRAGDVLLAVEDLPFATVGEFYDLRDSVPVQPVLDYLIERDGVTQTVQGPYLSPTRAVAASYDGAAAAAGVVEGDVVTAIDGTPVFAFQQMIDIVSASDGRTLTLDLWNAGTTRQIMVTPRRTDLPTADGFETRWLLGISGGLAMDFATETPSLSVALMGAVKQVVYVIDTSLSGISHMISGQISTCNLSSPVGIAQASGAMARAGLAEFIGFLGFLSAAIGLLNLMPIPVLDGGHLMFFAYEAVTRRKPSPRVMQMLVTLGLSLVLTMTILGVLNDTVLCP